MRGFSRIAIVAVFGVNAAVADDGRDTSVIVQKTEKQCFASLVKTTGYVVPRAPGVVMFNAPNFRITEVVVKDGDSVKRGDRVASATPVTPPAGGSGSNPTAVPIRSLVSGTVMKTNMGVGTLTSAKADPLLTLAVGGDFEVAADILNVHVPELRAGEKARIELPDGRAVEGHVRSAPVRIDRASQFGQARIAIDDKPLRGVGQFVRVAIETSRSCGVGVPRSALIQSSEGPRVQIVDRGAVATRTVRLGLLNDTDAEVLSGIGEGEFVVANAGTAFRDGDKVKPVFSDLQDAQ